MRKYILILALLMSFNTVLLGQKNSIKLEIINCVSTKTSIIFCLKITNVSNYPISTYIPKDADICTRILKIKVIDLLNSKVYELSPCSFYKDLDAITLNSNNTLSLKPDEAFNQRFQFSKKDISPYLKKTRSYKLFVEWNLKDVNFITDLKNLIQEDLNSNEFAFRNL